MYSSSSSPSRIRGRTPLSVKDANAVSSSSSKSPLRSTTSNMQSNFLTASSTRSTSPVKAHRGALDVNRALITLNNNSTDSVLSNNGSNSSGSPSKRPSPVKGLRCSSPSKKQKSSNTILSSSSAGALSFKIFEDPVDYRTQQLPLKFNEALVVTDVSNKENERLNQRSAGKVRKLQLLKSNERLALHDLKINEYPGFIQHHYDNNNNDGALLPKQQLQNSWMLNFHQADNQQAGTVNSPRFKLKNGKLKVPSFVTPPKKNKNIIYKYIQSLQQNSQTARGRSCIDGELLESSSIAEKTLQRSFTDADLDLGVVNVKRQLTFNVFNDVINQ